MATGNFLTVGASKVFAFDGDEFDVDYIASEVYDELEKRVRKTEWDIVKEDKWDGERSYPAHYFADIYTSFYYWEAEIYISIKLGTRSGYYQGGNLDYDVNIYWDETHYEDLAVLEDDMDRWPEDAGAETGKGIFRHNLPKFIGKVEKNIDEIREIIEEVYEKHTQPLCKVAQFSNGETIYEAC